MIPTLLLTGFEPFGARSVNISWEVAQEMRHHISKPPQAPRVESVMLPVRFSDDWEVLSRQIDQIDRTAVLVFGEGGEHVRIEQTARNTFFEGQCMCPRWNLGTQLG